VGNLYVADANNARVTKGTQAYFQFRVSAGSLVISNHTFHAWLTGPPNSTVVLEASNDLRLWVPVQTNTLPPGGMQVGWIPSGIPYNFLRSRLEP
jgi:hypothetical protein